MYKMSENNEKGNTTTQSSKWLNSIMCFVWPTVWNPKVFILPSHERIRKFSEKTYCKNGRVYVYVSTDSRKDKGLKLPDSHILGFDLVFSDLYRWSNLIYPI